MVVSGVDSTGCVPFVDVGVLLNPQVVSWLVGCMVLTVGI